MKVVLEEAQLLRDQDTDLINLVVIDDKDGWKDKIRIRNGAVSKKLVC